MTATDWAVSWVIIGGVFLGAFVAICVSIVRDFGWTELARLFALLAFAAVFMAACISVLTATPLLDVFTGGRR